MLVRTALLVAACGEPPPAPLEPIAISADGRHFEAGGAPFVPWGFNYDHDSNGRLIEEYWEDEWEVVEEDFREMRELGANVVRVHLQVAAFLDGPDRPNEAALERLAMLVEIRSASACTWTSRAWAATARRTCPRGTRSSTRPNAGRRRRASGARSPSASARVPPSSRTT
ncbi:MAG TPA: hypothetical protein VIL20_12580 [Sandaracinaceae bacterium]